MPTNRASLLIALVSFCQPLLAQTPQGGSYLINSTTEEDQETPELAVGSDGRLVAVWIDESPELVASVIRAQRLLPDGTPVGDEMQASTSLVDFPRDPAVAVAADHSYLVVWGGPTLSARLFTPAGAPDGGVFDLSAEASSDPAVVAAPGGGWIVVWTASDSNVLGLRLEADGAAIGSAFGIETNFSGFARDPDLAVRTDGNFVVVWTSSNGGGGIDTDGDRVLGRRFAADGTPLAVPFAVNTTTEEDQREARIAMTPDGRFAVAWASDTSAGSDDSDQSVQMRRWDADGIPQGADVQVNVAIDGDQDHPDIAMADDGRFVVVWEDDLTTSTTDIAIVGRLYSADGSPAAAPFEVSDGGEHADFSTVALGPDGQTLVVAWQSDEFPSPDAEFEDIRGRHYTLPFGPSGRVWHDLDFDGVQDEFEPGLEGIRVELQEPGGATADAVFTDLEGNFRFTPPFPGDYLLTFTSLNGLVFTMADIGSDDLDSDVDPTTGSTPVFTEPDSGTAAWDAGLVTASMALGDRVWIDIDGDGMQGLREPGLWGVELRLHPAQLPTGQPLTTATSIATGNYLLEWDLEDVFIEARLPLAAITPRGLGGDGSLDSDFDPNLGTTEIIDARPGNSLEWDLGVLPFLGDQVWHDLNRDGIRGPNEPGLAGIIVQLLDAGDNVLFEATTDSHGYYAFPSLPGGSYRLQVQLPPGMTVTLADQGDDDELDSDFDALGSTPLIGFAAGTVARSWDVGLVEPVLFADGFESGNTSRWTEAVP